MPSRATKRGDERTPLSGDYDVLICGASFAGLDGRPRARGHRRARADDRPLRDRRAPDERVRRADGWLRNLGLVDAIRQTLRRARHPHPAAHAALAAAVDVLDLRLPRALRAAARAARGRASSRRPRSSGRDRRHASTPTAATSRAPLIVDALGWRRMLAPRAQRPAARRAPVARAGGPPRRRGDDLELWIDPEVRPAPATAGRSRPTTRCASASAPSTRATTSRSRRCGWPTTSACPPSG